MRRRPFPTLIACLLIAAMATLAGAGAASAACVRGVAPWDTLRMRSGPGAGFAEVGHIPPGACGVAVRGACRGLWCPVAFGPVTGWSNARYLDSGARRAVPVRARAPAPARSSVCVRGLPGRTTLKVRATPSPAGALLYGFHNGSCGVRITGSCAGGYCPVEYRGYRGWADSRYLR